MAGASIPVLEWILETVSAIPNMTRPLIKVTMATE
jgi:hypothetical protein